MANRLESIWDALRNSMNPEEEQASPIGNSYSQGHGYNYPVPNEWGNSNQTTATPTSSLSQIPESARQSIDLGRPPIVQNMDYMNSFVPTPFDMASIPHNTTGEEHVAPVEEPGFLDTLGQGVNDMNKGIGDFFGDEERMARMTIALNSMRLNPDPNIAKSMELKLDRLHKNKGRNATVIKLREKGRNDLADAVESGAMKATDAWTLAFKDDKDTATITNLKWRATQAGLKEGTEEYRNFMLNSGGDKGMSLTVAKDGTISFSQGGGNGKDKALTEGQSNATMFYGRMQNANKLLDGFEGQGTVLGNALLNKVPLLGNYLISDEGQQYEQAKTNFLTALLRKESGAKIGEEEVELGDSQYFPQPGDSPEVVAQKKINRTNVVKYMRIVASGGADKIDEIESQQSTTTSTQDKNIPTATTVQQLDALKKGTKYKDSMGNVRTKTWN